MKQAFLLAAALVLAAFPLRAQAPVNDAFDCATMVNLGLVPACQPTVYTNKNATPSIIATVDTVSCFQSTTAKRDVWFRFQCPISLIDLRITVAGTGSGPITNPEFAVYRGNCAFDQLFELSCVSAGQGQNGALLDLFGLTPGLNYYLRVSDWSVTANPNWGDFTICIDSIPPVVNITEGSSSLCSGTLYDSGGEFGDYGPNENHTFVICPDQPSECITFSLEYYNLEPTANPMDGGDGDQLYFYDGNSTSAPLLAALDGAGISAQNIAGGGGVCFQVQAQSGCLTVRFRSNNAVQQEGWKGSWQCSSDPCLPVEKLSVNTGISAADIENAVATGGTQVTVTSVFCDPEQYGTFQFATEKNDLAMEKGLLLTSGRAANAEGPNDFDGLGAIVEPFGDFGDGDLNYLSAAFGGGSESHDACIVELDVFAATNEVVFEYVFGSEEYPEFIFSEGGFNDIFAFLVSGPGIAGDPNLSNSALNIAVLPNSSNTLVQIDSVNYQANWQYYRNNQLGQAIQYDGLTSDYLGLKKSLTARVPVTPCNTYHLKLAIADRGDESYDSGVFVSKIKAGSPAVAIQFASGIDYFIESCSGNKDTLFITLSKVPTQVTSFNISLGGTATEGLDYQLDIPSTITFQPGQSTLAFPIIPIGDAIPEGAETILINLSRDYGCGEVVLETLMAELKDGVTVEVSGGDTLKVCRGDFLQLGASGADTYFWEPTDAVSNPYIADPVTSPNASTWIWVTGTVGTCTDVDSVFVRVVDPSVVATATTPSIICLGGSVQLEAIVNPPGTPFIWFPTDGLDDPNSLTPLATPTFPVTYGASVTLDGCTVTSYVNVIVDTLHFPTLIADTVLCQNYPVQLAAPLSSTTQYAWTPSNGLDDPNTAAPIATPDMTTTYTLTATSPNGACTQSASLTVNITLADVDISGEYLRLLCLGETDTLIAIASPPGSNVTWSPAFLLNTATGPVVQTSPDESATITAQYIVNGCTVYDSVHIKVDSLPDQAIRKVLDKEVYCPGDTIYMLSNTYEPANFPGIEHMWLPHGTFLTPDDYWNLVILTIDTFTYQRITKIGGCLDTAEVLVPVYIPPTLTASAMPPIICPGSSSEINVTVTPITPEMEFEWDPLNSGTLSCDDCLSPSATPTQTTMYQMQVKGIPCPTSVNVAVFVEPFPVLDLADNPVICNAGGVVLNSSSQNDVSYTWTPATGLNNPNIANPVASPNQTTTYHVVAEGPNCTTEGDVTVTVYKATINAGQDKTICAGQSATLTANITGDPGSLVWQPGGQSSNTITVTPDLTTVYSAIYSFGENCVITDEVKVTVNPYPNLNFNPDTAICLGESINLTLAPLGPGNYIWTPASGLDNPNAPSPLATPTSTTTYQVAASNQNCSVSGQITISVAAANINVGQDQSICEGESTTLVATTSGSPGTIVWFPTGETTPNITVSPTALTVYTATLSYGDNCKISDQVIVEVIPLPNLNFNPDPRVCRGDTIALTVPDFGPGSYAWSPATGLNNANIPNPLAFPTQTTTYNVTATNLNCSVSGSVIVEVAFANVNAGQDQEICFGSSATLTATVTGAPADSIIWQWPNNTRFENPVTVSPVQSANYQVTIKYGPDCVDTDVVRVDLFERLVLGKISASPDPGDSICEGATVKLRIEPSSGETIESYTWLANGVPIAGATKDSVEVTPLGSTVSYAVIATDVNGCTAQSDSIVFVTKRCFEIPNAFSPNGDGANDTFGPVLLGGAATVTTFVIYNRWGQKVFVASAEKKTWDGRSDGKDAPSDVYVYHMTVRFGNGEEESFDGEVTLLR